ncbi:MAG: hypothetical protein COW30_14500, partial [Rhodospirillales bacterium CG15_BIG_FIL_POST_REV_8_21_14_020_66_15]
DKRRRALVKTNHSEQPKKNPAENRRGLSAVWVVLRTTDTGCGIAQDSLPGITEPFARGDMDPYKSVEGWGLGLAICKTLIEKHDGRIEIESAAGRGTTVSVILPAEASQPKWRAWAC